MLLFKMLNEKLLGFFFQVLNEISFVPLSIGNFVDGGYPLHFDYIKILFLKFNRLNFKKPNIFVDEKVRPPNEPFVHLLN